jgi:hypothetical protein
MASERGGMTGKTEKILRRRIISLRKTNLL